MAEEEKVLRLCEAGCRRDDSLITREITEIGGARLICVGDDGIEYPMKFVVRGLTVKELRMVRRLEPNIIMRQRQRITAEGKLLYTEEGRAVNDSENYFEIDRNAALTNEAMAILALGGDVSETMKADAGANEQTGCGWYIDGKKRKFDRDTWDSLCWKSAELLKRELIRVANELTVVPDDYQKKSVAPPVSSGQETI